ncbi:MAG: DUF58 domain-containing protein [Aliifodinibius sp.]|nr:DUF58 domain-containing protein [Fodinibius sp.]
MWFRRIFRLGNFLTKSELRSEDQNDQLVPRLAPEALRQLNRLQIRGSKALRGDGFGIRSSNRGKPAMEFREHRMYVPGDDIRFVDWKASARNEKIFVRQGEMPKDVLVYLLLDCSASMLWGHRSKRETQLALASALGYTALKDGDRLYVSPYGDMANIEFGPVIGKGYLSSYIRYLNQLNYGGQSNLENAVRTIKQKFSRGGVVFIMSDLLEKGDLSAILSHLPAPKWWVNVLHLLHPGELNPEIRGFYELEDRETGQLRNYDLTKEAMNKYRERVKSWRSQLELHAVDHHAFYFLIKTDWSLSREVIPYLREHQVLVSE